MSGSDTSRGINFQYAWGVSFILDFPYKPHWHVLQLEGENDIEDILVLDANKNILICAQIKQKQDPNQWKASEIKDILLKFARRAFTEETIYQFIYAGSEGREFHTKIRPILEKLGSEGFENLSLIDKELLHDTFGMEIVTFLQKIGHRLELIPCGPRDSIRERDLRRILKQLNTSSHLEKNIEETIYRSLLEAIEIKTEDTSKYHRCLKRQDIMGLLRSSQLSETDIKNKEIKQITKLNEKEITQNIIFYLEIFSKRLGNLPDYYPKQTFTFDQIRQKVKISHKRLFYNQERNISRETARRAGIFEEDIDIRQVKLEIAYQWRTPEMYNDQAVQEEEIIVDWDDIRNKVERTIILGDPGFGKSWLLKYEGRYIAHEQISLLKEHKIEVDDVQLPIHIRLATLAEALDKTNSNLLEAILSIIQNEYKLEIDTLSYMKSHIVTSKCTLMLDALDEVVGNKKQSLIEALKTWSEDVECKILLTSRIAGYREAPFTLKSHDTNQELELVAIDWEQVVAFINNWFGNDNEQAKNLISQLQSEPILRSQTRIPLLLSFICLIAMRHMKIPKRRTNLYDTVIRLLLEGPWRESHLREYDEGRLEEKIHLLRDIAWYFATFKGVWHDLFISHDLNSAIKNSSTEQYLLRTASHNNSILWELNEQDGILVKAGEPSLGIAKSQIPYLFLHRTFHEFLVASYLSKLDIKQWLQFIKKHIWFDPDWEIVIILLAGCLDNPQPLLEVMINEEDDIFHTQLLLAGRCLGEVKKDLISPDIKEKIIGRLFNLLHSTSERNRDQASLVLSVINNSLIPDLLKLAHGNKAYTRRASIKALGLLGNSQVGEHLVSILCNRNENWEVRAEAAKALGNVDYPSSIKNLIEATEDKFIAVRISALEALGQIRNTTTIEKILSRILDDKEERAVIDAAYRALKRMGTNAENTLLNLWSDQMLYRKTEYLQLLSSFNSPNVLEFLLKIATDKYQNPSLRHFAILYLGDSYGSKCTNVFISIIDDRAESFYIHTASIHALGKTDREIAARKLLLLLKSNTSLAVRKELLGALCSMNPLYSSEGIIQALNDKNYIIRNMAVNTLDFNKNLKDDRIIKKLIDLSLNDKYERIRWIANSILAKNGCVQMTNHWLNILSQKDSGYSKIDALKGLHRANSSFALDKTLEVLKDGNVYKPYLIDLLSDIGDPIVLEELLILLTNKNESFFIRSKAAEALEKLMQNSDPINFCTLIFKYWESSKHARGSKSLLYFLLTRIGPKLRIAIREDWAEWRSRLILFDE